MSVSYQELGNVRSTATTTTTTAATTITTISLSSASARSPAPSVAHSDRSSSSLLSYSSGSSSDEELRSALAFHPSYSTLSLSSQKSASFSSLDPYHPYSNKQGHHSHSRHVSNAHGRQVPNSFSASIVGTPVAAPHRASLYASSKQSFQRLSSPSHYYQSIGTSLSDVEQDRDRDRVSMYQSPLPFSHSSCSASTGVLPFQLAYFDPRLTPQSPLIQNHPIRSGHPQGLMSLAHQREHSKSRPQLPVSPSAECVGNICTDHVSCAYCQARYNTPEGYLIVKPGTLLGERYAVQQVIGQGTFGTVISALDTLHEHEPVAIKIIRAIPKYRRAARIEIDILERLGDAAGDSSDSKYCIEMLYWFEFRHHICMVFPLLAMDLYNWLQADDFRPFSLAQIQRIALQLFKGLAHLHSLGIIHTDLKPENVLLKSSAKASNGQLKSTDISLIDFGSAVHFSHFHGDIVSTRHYRAPEIILELGWSFPCDIWSLGCLLVELWQGTQLYTTHDNISHLSHMEEHHGLFPTWMIQKSDACLSHGYSFFKAGRVHAHGLPKNHRQKASLSHIILSLGDETDPNVQAFYDLVKSCLQLDPAKRVTASKATHHPFFSAQL